MFMNKCSNLLSCIDYRIACSSLHSYSKVKVNLRHLQVNGNRETDIVFNPDYNCRCFFARIFIVLVCYFLNTRMPWQCEIMLQVWGNDGREYVSLYFDWGCKGARKEIRCRDSLGNQKEFCNMKRDNDKEPILNKEFSNRNLKSVVIFLYIFLRFRSVS